MADRNMEMKEEEIENELRRRRKGWVSLWQLKNFQRGWLMNSVVLTGETEELGLR